MNWALNCVLVRSTLPNVRGCTRNRFVSAPEVTPEDRAAGRVIETARVRRGMSVSELARRAGISRGSLYLYVEGSRAMTLGVFRALCDVLEVTREEAADSLDRELAALDDPDE
jgi:AcrR family transcriptional regulator